MSKGDAVCCIQMQTAQRQTDVKGMDIISGVTSGPCGPIMTMEKDGSFCLSILTLLPVVLPGTEGP